MSMENEIVKGSLEDEIFKGSQVKVFVHLERIGSLSMDDYDFTIECYTEMSSRVVTFPKSKAYKLDEDTYFVVLDTSKLDLGYLKVRVVAAIPDTEVEGLRNEVIVFGTGRRIVKSV